jgi:hypothetical protein
MVCYYKITEKKGREKMKERVKQTLFAISIVLLIASAIAYFLDKSFSGYIVALAVPLCFVALYLSLKPSKNKIPILLHWLCCASSFLGASPLTL